MSKNGESYDGQIFCRCFMFLFLSFVIVSKQVQAKTEELKGLGLDCLQAGNSQRSNLLYVKCTQKLRGDYDRANRGETRVFSHGPGKAERDVVSVLAGYRYKSSQKLIFPLIRKA